MFPSWRPLECVVTETSTGAVPGVVDVVVTPLVPADGAPSRPTPRQSSRSTDTYTPVPATLEVTKVIGGPAAGLQGDVQLDVQLQ